MGFGGAVFTISAGSFTGTIGFYASGDGGVTWSPLAVMPSMGIATVTTAVNPSGTTAYQVNTSAYTQVCMLMSANTAGSVVAKIHLSPISARVGGSAGGGSGGPASLSSLTAATAANTLANGANNQTWNWTNPAAGNSFTLGETAASTGGTVTGGINNQSILQVSTQPGSTATPLSILQGTETTTTPLPALQIQSTWNNMTGTFSGITESVTNTMSGAGSSLLNLMVGGTTVFNVNPTGGVTASGLSVMNAGLNVNNGNITISGSTNFVQSPTFRPTANPGLAATTSTNSLVLQGGGDNNLANVLGGLAVRGANVNGSIAGGTAGGAFLQGGYINSATVTTSMFGPAEMMTAFWRGTVANAFDVVCATTTQNQMTDCPASTGLNMLGIAVSNAGLGAASAVVTEGQVPVRLDAALLAIGDTVCLSTTTAGLGHDNQSAAPCTTAGSQIGIIIASSGTVQVGSAASATAPQSIALSTTVPLVQLRFR